MTKHRVLAVFLFAGSLSSTAFAAPVLFSVGGDNTAASIQAVVDDFRAALGDPNNGNAPGPLPSGRREINWDGGGDATSVAGTPFDGFLNIRGARFATPGTGFVQAPPAGGPGGGLASVFGNPTYGTIFTTFSPLRLFAPIGSNVTDVLFFIPGSAGATPATVAGFGAVFTDVDLANTTTLQYFDLDNDPLGTFSVPAAAISTGGLSFLGVLFDAGEQVARVRITTGSSALGPTDGGGVDVVAMDDFLYSEPAAAAVPEPVALWLFGAAGAMTAVRRRLQRARSAA